MSFDMLNESLREGNLPLSLRSFERGGRDKQQHDEERGEGRRGAGTGEMKEGGLVLALLEASWKAAAAVDGTGRGRNATSGHMTPLDQPATLLFSYFRLVARASSSFLTLSIRLFFPLPLLDYRAASQIGHEREKQTPAGCFFDFR